MGDSREDPLVLCTDGSENAKHAIRRAGELLSGRHALVVTVWESVPGLSSLAWASAMTPMLNYVEVNRAVAEASVQIAQEGLGIAREAGLEPELVVVEATRAVWKTIIEIADSHDAAVIVMGSRGLTGVESILTGSVSSHVLHHAGRPTLVIPGDHRRTKAPEIEDAR
jgi:nucleotide-binding universal stress UspA family protein